MLRAARQEPRRRHRGGRSGRLRRAARRAAMPPASTSIDTRSRLAAKAFAHTAAYDTLVADYLTQQQQLPVERFPPRLPLVLDAHRRAALRREPAPARRVLPQLPGARRHSIASARFAAGQGTVVQQHRRCRHRARMRAPVRRAGLRDRQARQSLRRRDGRAACATPTNCAYRTDPDLRLRRHHRLQPRARCRHRARDPRAAVRRSASWRRR